MKRAVRYFWNPSKPHLQPIRTTLAERSEREGLERGGWLEIDRRRYQEQMEEWRKWREWNEGAA